MKTGKIRKPFSYTCSLKLFVDYLPCAAKTVLGTMTGWGGVAAGNTKVNDKELFFPLFYKEFNTISGTETQSSSGKLSSRESTP